MKYLPVNGLSGIFTCNTSKAIILIIITDKPGQLGNQLWAYTNLIALAKECNSGILIILSRNYYKMFDTEHIKNHRNIHILIEDSFTAKLVRWFFYSVRFRSKNKNFLLSFLKKIRLEFIEDHTEEEKFKLSYKRFTGYFISSWEQRSNKAFFIKHSVFIQSLFIPEIKIGALVAERMQALKAKGSSIVGVHIRRGDYAHHLGGKYYFEDIVYRNYMNQINHLLGTDNTLFYIFSNEAIDIANFSGLNIHFFNDQLPVTDLWAMSKCDYLMGPPSTFSMWASFWNNSPLWFMEDDNSVVSLNQFKPVIAQDVFKQ